MDMKKSIISAGTHAFIYSKVLPSNLYVTPAGYQTGVQLSPMVTGLIVGYTSSTIADGITQNFYDVKTNSERLSDYNAMMLNSVVDGVAAAAILYGLNPYVYSPHPQLPPVSMVNVAAASAVSEALALGISSILM